MVRGFVDDYGHRWVAKDDHKQAIAEKDREIEAKDTELGKQDAELIVLRAAYQQLMEKAVGFAENMIAVMTLVRTRDELEANGLVTAARKFLESPDAEAFLSKKTS